jgi:transcriptional regulator with XRE-family HTH domain
MRVDQVLRQARRRSGLTQRQLATLTGIAQPTIARIETGESVPRVDTLDRLLGACGEEIEAGPRLGIGIDRTVIRQLLALSPLERMASLVQEGSVMERLSAARRLS